MDAHTGAVRALEAQPNAAHTLLAKMALPNYLKTVAPAAKTFHLITQNVDRLSARALTATIAEQSPETRRANRPRPESIIEMHGRLFDVQCTSPECGYVVENLSNPLCPALGDADALFASYHDAGSKDVDIPPEQLPRCAQCGALARPGVVWFGEKPLKLDEINQLVFKADMCLVVGTSSTVCSGACHRCVADRVMAGSPCGWLRISRQETWWDRGSLQLGTECGR